MCSLSGHVSAMEIQLQKEKSEKQKLLRNHREEIRRRDRKEMIFLCVVAVCVVDE